MDLHMLRGRGCGSAANPFNDSDTDTAEALPRLAKSLSLPRSVGSDQGVSYKECLKNHAAKLGGLSLDGCGEFMAITSATHEDPSSLKCAACGCHRNFHRRDLAWSSSPDSSSPTTTTSSPAPIDRSSPYYSYPPGAHMLLGLAPMGPHREAQEWAHPHGSKRARTKFTQDQKVKMHEFAEKLGWRMARGPNDDKLVEAFCREVGVRRNVFKVWMHNNKHRKDKPNASTDIHIDSANTVPAAIHQDVDGYQIVERKVFGSSPSS